VLAIDADPNSCMADALGVKNAASIVGICDDISKNMSRIPAGMTKDRFIEMSIQEAVTESKGFDLLVMGRPEGPGCYCYVNNLLRNVIAKITDNYDYVVIDNAAGMEHISRRTVGSLGKLVLVSDFSVQGVRAAKKIYELAMDMKIKLGGAYLIVNRVTGPIGPLKEEIKKTGLELIGEVPYSQRLVEWSISDRPVFEFADEEIIRKIGLLAEKLIGVKDASRTH
jgi:CO dehydrogenase maturation factor